METSKGLKMKEIRIFLASSYELEPDRARIGNLIRQLNDECYERQNIHLRLVKWEDLDSFYNQIDKQIEYDFQIENSRLFIGLFWHIAGRHTIHEVELARNNMPSENVFIFHKTAEFKPDHEGSEDEKRFLERHPNEKLNESREEFETYLKGQNSLPYADFNGLRQILTEKLADRCNKIIVSKENKGYAADTLQIHVAASPEAEPDLARLGDLVRYLDENSKYYCRIKLIREIPDSDMFVSICHTSAPEPMPQDIQTAIDCNSTSSGKPRIYFCMKHVPDEDKQESLKNLETQISSILKHYPDRYYQSAEMKLHFLLQLEQLKRSRGRDMLVVEDGTICLQIGGRKCPLMSCDDMPSLQNDQGYKRLEDEQRRILGEIEKFRARDEISADDLSKELFRLNQELVENKQQINDKQTAFFRVAHALEEMVGREQAKEIDKVRTLIGEGKVDQALLLMPDSQVLDQQWQEEKKQHKAKALRYYDSAMLTIDCLYASNLRKNLEKILEFCNIAIDTAKAMKDSDSSYLAKSFLTYSSFLWMDKKFDEAVSSAKEALSIYEKDNLENVVDCYIFIGDIYLDKGDASHDTNAYHQALENYEEAERIAENIKADFPDVFSAIAAVQTRMGKPDKALANLNKALDIIQSHDSDDNIPLIAQYRLQMGKAYSVRNLIKSDPKNTANAINSFNEALERFQSIGDDAQSAECYMRLANEYENNDIELAKKNSEKAIQILTNICRDDPMVIFNITLRWLELATGKIARGAAINLFEVILKKPMGSTLMASIYHNIGVIYFRNGNYVEAYRNYMNELNCLSHQEKQNIALCFFHIGHTWFKRGKYAAARNYYIKAASAWKNLDKIPSSDMPMIRTNAMQIGSAFRNAIATYGKHHMICARFYAPFLVNKMIQKKMNSHRNKDDFDENTARQ